ncbi:PAS domain S-box protein [Marinobacteraceae bacterium S3BR75-40.1]
MNQGLKVPEYFRKYGPITWAVIYLLVAVLLGVGTEWATYGLRGGGEYTLLNALDLIIYVAITAAIFLRLLQALKRHMDATRYLLAQTERTYKELFANHPHPMWIFEPENGDILEANEAAVKRYRWSHEDFRQLNLGDVQPPENIPALKASLAGPERSSDHLIVGIFQHWDRDHRRFWVEIATNTILHEGKQARMATLVDVTATVEANRQLKQAVHRLEEAKKLGRLGFWEWEPGSQMLLLSEGMRIILGLPRDLPDKVDQHYLLDFIHPDDRADWLASRAADSDENEVQLWRGRAPDGRVRHLRQRTRSFVEDGRQRVMGSVIDETDRVKQTRALRDREQQYRTLVEQLPCSVVLHGPEGLVFANAAFRDMLNLDEGQSLLHTDIRHFAPNAEQRAILDDLLQVDVGEGRGPDAVREVQLSHQSGELLVVAAVSRRIRLHDTSLVQLVLWDVTEERRMRSELHRANLRLTHLTSQSLRVLENERNMLSRELHDDIGQLLSAIKVNAGAIERCLSSNPSVEKKLLQINDIVAEAIGKVRDMSRMLRPPQLDQLGLKAAVVWQVERILDGSEIEYRIEAPHGFQDLHDDIAVAAFRIIQESVTNVVRHASAQVLTIDLAPTPEGHALRITILDDGCGFDLQAVDESLGLVNMRERAELAGGHLAIRSTPGMGTEVQVVLPIIKKQETEVWEGSKHDASSRVADR